MMARKVLVSLVGKQSAPNVTFIQEQRETIHKYLFISTQESEQEKYSEAVIKGTKVNPENCIIVQVEAEKISTIKEILDGLDIEDDNYFLVNITGGTKMMALGTYNYFTSDKFKNRCEIFYLPIGKSSYQKIYPESGENLIQSTISIKDYLISYSLKVLSTSHPLKSIEYTNLMFEKTLLLGNQNQNLIEKLQNFRSKGIKKIAEIDSLQQYLDDISFPQDDIEKLSSYEVKYLTGGWFEEWTYHLIKQFIPTLIDDQTICLGVNIEQIAQNDFDIIFIMQSGKICVIECKTFISNEALRDTTIYKSSALRSRFGLAVQSYLFTLSNLRDSQNNIVSSLQKRANAEKVALVDNYILTSESNLVNFFQNLI